MADEKKLLSGLIKKHEKALEQAITLYTPYLSAVLYNYTGGGLSLEDTEEIISDIFVMLWESAERIDLSKGTIRSYIASAAKKQAAQRFREMSLNKTSPTNDLYAADTAVSAEEIVIEKEIWKEVMSLGEPDSEIFIRFYKYGEKLSDIAKSTGLNLSTVKTKLSRGKIKLRKIISENTEGSI